MQSIYSGSLTPSEANLIREYTSNFQELVSIGSKISTWPKDLPNSEDVLHTFTVLCDQICQFETKKEELQCVADKCIYIMDIEGQSKSFYIFYREICILTHYTYIRTYTSYVHNCIKNMYCLQCTYTCKRCHYTYTFHVLEVIVCVDRIYLRAYIHTVFLFNVRRM